MRQKESKVVIESIDASFDAGYKQGYEQGLKDRDKWIPIDELKNYKDVDESKMLILFDTGEVINHSDENWPFAESTHFIVMK